MKYRRVVNRRLDQDGSGADAADPVLAGPCWPEDHSLPRVVQRKGEIVLDEAWVRVEDGEDDDPTEAGV